MALFTLDVVMFLLFSDVTDHSETKGKTRGTRQTKDSTQGTGQTQGSTQGTGQTKKSTKGTGQIKKSKQSTGQTKNRTLEAGEPGCTTQDPVLTGTDPTQDPILTETGPVLRGILKPRKFETDEGFVINGSRRRVQSINKMWFEHHKAYNSHTEPNVNRSTKIKLNKYLLVKSFDKKNVIGQNEVVGNYYEQISDCSSDSDLSESVTQPVSDPSQSVTQPQRLNPDPSPSDVTLISSHCNDLHHTNVASVKIEPVSPSFDSGIGGESFNSQLDGEGHITAVEHQGSTSLASVSSVIQSASTLDCGSSASVSESVDFSSSRSISRVRLVSVIILIMNLNVCI